MYAWSANLICQTRCKYVFGDEIFSNSNWNFKQFPARDRGRFVILRSKRDSFLPPPPEVVRIMSHTLPCHDSGVESLPAKWHVENSSTNGIGPTFWGRCYVARCFCQTRVCVWVEGFSNGYSTFLGFHCDSTRTFGDSCSNGNGNEGFNGFGLLLQHGEFDKRTWML